MGTVTVWVLAASLALLALGALVWAGFTVAAVVVEWRRGHADRG